MARNVLIECLESSFLCIAADTWLGNLSRKMFFCGPLRASATPHADHAADTGGLVNNMGLHDTV